MFGKRQVRALINRSTADPVERRRFLKSASATGLGLVGAGLLSSVADPAKASAAETAARGGFYSHGVNGSLHVSA